jgi:3-oxoacyl-[acyl-carrier protein] reductase
MVMSKIQSRVMLITGCASGIGKHLLQKYGGQGHRIIATDVETKALKTEVAKLFPQSNLIKVCKLDVRSISGWERTLKLAHETFGHLDVVMNVAGYLRAGNMLDGNPQELIDHMRINAEGVMLGTHLSAQWMVNQSSGHIINIGSLASLAPVPGLSAYCASKHAVRAFSLAVAQELEGTGVAISVLLPDAVDTPMLDKQVHTDAAALTFSGSKPLSVTDVSNAIDQILVKRTREVMLPARRGILAKAVGAAPGLARFLGPVLTRLGRANQKRHREGRKTGKTAESHR